MTYFLEHIAESLFNEYGNTLNRHCLVFPNRRAGLYFMKYLAARIVKPVWAPSTLTINELFRSYSSLQIAGNEILLFELYKVYINLKKQHESFDDFYYWGDMLLNDFDDVDKYLVDASILFRNVLDIKNIDIQFGELTDYQIEIIRRFWTNFNHDKPTDQKSGFISIWSIMLEIYNGFRNSLKEANLAYEGMIFREYAESQTTSDNRWDCIHFIGFNALNECEKVLMKRLKNEGKAKFYWDYDNSYINESKLNSAGFFLRDNLKIFGNDMPDGWNYDTMLSKAAPEVKRRVIDSSSDVAQVKLVTQLLEAIPGITMDNAHHTAVVLADENLLMPVLTSLPEDMGEINITMGLPLKQTLVYTFVKYLMDLQTNASTEEVTRFSHRDVTSILKHTLLSGLLSRAETDLLKEIIKTNLLRVSAERFSSSETLSIIFRKPATPADLSDYFKEILSVIALNDSGTSVWPKRNSVENNIRNEFIYRIVLSINRLEAIVKSTEVVFTTGTYMKILDRMLRIQTVPFSGEPLMGIQIMGILETRTLDFKNLIILSVNEGILPAVSAGSSFIPYSLREAFGLPSVNHQESIYAYHFYRLLQRAEDVSLVYNSNAEGLQSGEMSRFIIQMKYDEILKPDFFDLSFLIKTNIAYSDRIERTEGHSNLLEQLFLDTGKGRPLSPSAINTWLSCRMKFFYRYLYRLKEPESVSADIDPAMLGNIVHEIMGNLYTPYNGNVVSKDALYAIIKNQELLQNSVNDSVNKQFRSGRSESESGNELIVRDVLLSYVTRILNYDKSIAPLSILNLEDSFVFDLPLQFRGKELSIRTGGKVDRIDRTDKIRIVDYKTGIVADSISSVADLFVDDRKKDPDGWLQTLLYCEAYISANPGQEVRPSVYKIRKMAGGSHSDKLKIKTRSTDLVIENYAFLRDEFLDGLKGLINIIFSENEPFVKTSDIRGKCSFCPYKTLCAR